MMPHELLTVGVVRWAEELDKHDEKEVRRAERAAAGAAGAPLPLEGGAAPLPLEDVQDGRLASAARGSANRLVAEV